MGSQLAFSGVLFLSTDSGMFFITCRKVGLQSWGSGTGEAAGALASPALVKEGKNALFLRCPFPEY